MSITTEHIKEGSDCMDKAITGKIKALLAMAGKKNVELAEYLGMSAQALQNKLGRGSFSADDLIKIAEFTGAELLIQLGDDRIVLDSSCIRDKEA